MFAFIKTAAAEFSIQQLCWALAVSRSAYYEWQKRRPKTSEALLARQVRNAFWRHSRRYGSRRIHAELKADGVRVGRHKVRRIMKTEGLRAIQPKSFVPRTTDSRHGRRTSPNLLMDAALPAMPGAVMVGDITYLPLSGGGFAYLATWMDLFSRRILGWAVSEWIDEELILAAFKMLLRQKCLQPGVIIHSDRGGQYTGRRFRALLDKHKCRQSMSRAAETYDNAFAESLFSRYKAELLDGGAFSDVAEARTETFNYIEGYYNRVRRHSSLGYKSPLDFEAEHYKRENDKIDKEQKKGLKVEPVNCP